MDKISSYLDIGGEELSLSINDRNIEALCLSKISRKQVHRAMIHAFFSFKEYMEFALFDQEFGYYTTRPSIGIGKDFHTYPERFSPHYGFCIGEVIKKVWEKMVAANDLSPDDCFTVMELGAGNGVLARDILTWAERDESFFRAVNYQIGEISPELQKNQHEITRQFGEKISIISADARQLRVKPFKGVIISNELPDAFPVHKVRKNSNDRLEVAIVLPLISSVELMGLKRDLFHKILKEMYIARDYWSEIPSNSYILTKRTYLELKRMQADFSFDWIEQWVPAEYFPDVMKCRKQHPDFFDRMKPLMVLPLNTALRNFQKGCSDSLESGYVMTIDYQYDKFSILSSRSGVRTFPGNIPHEYRMPPGSCDITADVNATMLAVEGIRARLIPEMFCSEKELFTLTAECNRSQIIPLEGYAPSLVLISKKEGTNASFPTNFESRPITNRDLFIALIDRYQFYSPRGGERNQLILTANKLLKGSKINLSIPVALARAVQQLSPKLEEFLLLAKKYPSFQQLPIEKRKWLLEGLQSEKSACKQLILLVNAITYQLRHQDTH